MRTVIHRVEHGRNVRLLPAESFLQLFGDELRGLGQIVDGRNDAREDQRWIPLSVRRRFASCPWTSGPTRREP